MQHQSSQYCRAAAKPIALALIATVCVISVAPAESHQATQATVARCPAEALPQTLSPQLPDVIPRPE